MRPTGRSDPIGDIHHWNRQDRHWLDAPTRFNVKVFRPQLIDHLLVLKTNVPDRKLLVLRNSGSGHVLDIRD